MPLLPTLGRAVGAGVKAIRLLVRGSVRGEIIAEFKNLFNAELLSGITTSRTVDALGNPTTAIPSDPYQFTNPSGAEQRKFQLGFKVRF